MNPRIKFGRFLIRLGGFVNSLAVTVMRPDDLVEFSRRTYAKTETVQAIGHESLIEAGLRSDETDLLDKIPLKAGRLLLLGIGGGREAIPLAKLGFEVIGVDFVPDMVKKAKENAARCGVKIETMVQEISSLDVPENFYDMVWLTSYMYSAIPTRNRRIEMLRKIAKALKPEGHFLCQFQWGSLQGHSRKGEIVRRIFAYLTLGNRSYESGDMLWGNVEFIHAFSSETDLRFEFREGGFDVVFMHIPDQKTLGGAILKKSQ
jgi:SAM-dependent methyltransferase